MRGHTHVLVGAAAGAALAAPLLPMIGRPAGIVLVGSAALASLMPDLDHPYSLAGRWVPQILAPACFQGPYHCGRRWFWLVTIWHRNEFHSIGAAGILAAIPVVLLLRINSLFVVLVSCAIFLGYCSHLLLDLVNVTPQMLFWPFSKCHFKPRWWSGVRENSGLGKLSETLVSLPALLVLMLCVISSR